MTHLGNHTVGIAAIHEVVVDELAHFRLQLHVASLIVGRSDETGGGVVVPVDAIALDGLIKVGIVLQIVLLHATVLTPLTHLAILQQTDAVDALVSIESPCLLHLPGTRIGTCGDGCESTLALSGEEVALAVGKRDKTALHGNGKC